VFFQQILLGGEITIISSDFSDFSRLTFIGNPTMAVTLMAL
jgi:hypothetical protein